MTQPRGRPPLDNPMSERFYIRVTPQEKAEIYAFSKSAGYSLLDLLRKGVEAVKAESQQK